LNNASEIFKRLTANDDIKNIEGLRGKVTNMHSNMDALKEELKSIEM
jgi:hypothetical protein